MRLPFSHDEFLDVFGAYNAQWWPVALVLWFGTAVIAWRWWRGRTANAPLTMSLLAVHWAWAGIAYHWLHFRAINPAAALFAVAFVLQAGLFSWLAIVTRARVTRQRGMRGAFSVGLVGFGLLYPAIGLALGLEYPRMPVFAVPCPTTLVTAGLLLATREAPRILSAIPLLWAAIGSSAAIMLGIRADLALIVAGLALLVDAIAPSVLGPVR